MFYDNLALSPEALTQTVGAVGSATEGQLSSSIFDDTFLGESLQKENAPASAPSSPSYGGNGGNGSYIATDGTNSYTFSSNSANQSQNTSIIEHGIDYQNIDVGILMQEPSLILAIAVILEMFLPLGRRFKLDVLMG